MMSMNVKEAVIEATSHKPYSCRPVKHRFFGCIIPNGWAIDYEFEGSEIMRVTYKSDAKEIARLLNVAYAEGRLTELKESIA